MYLILRISDQEMQKLSKQEDIDDHKYGTYPAWIARFFANHNIAVDVQWAGEISFSTNAPGSQAVYSSSPPENEYVVTKGERIA